MRYGGYAQLFTDGFKTVSHVGCFMVGPSASFVSRIDEKARVFTAEVYGLQLAVDSILEKELTQ